MYLPLFVTSQVTDFIYHCRSPHTFLTVLGGFRLCWYATIALHPKSSNIQVPNRTEGGVSAVALIQVCLPLVQSMTWVMDMAGWCWLHPQFYCDGCIIYILSNNVVFKCRTWAEVDHLTPQWGHRCIVWWNSGEKAGNMSGWLNININNITETKASGWFDAVL